MSKPNGDMVRLVGDTGHRIWINRDKGEPSYYHKIEGQQQQLIDEKTYHKTRQFLEEKGKPF